MPRFVGLDQIDTYFVADLHGDACQVPGARRGGRRFSNIDHLQLLEQREHTVLGLYSREVSAATTRTDSLADQLVVGLSPRAASLVRAVLAGRSLHQVAADTGSSVQAVSQRLARLRRRLPSLDQWWLARHAARQGRLRRNPA